MPDISLAQFNRIASGDYNAGQIDFKTAKDGSTELVKINNHVWQTSKNIVALAEIIKNPSLLKTARAPQIVVPVQAKQDGPYEFKPLVVDGKEVVRPLTAEDIDTIGKACLFNSVNI